ncbi:DUF2158 domain-containing protein [Yersinia intermedia]|uniref:DUF2158 domain-containing protein n=1 Tax=Yersinia intermedia TaxID=631 RepID=UPI00065D5A26|nr:DUF2158 domain-containing protein [Yersinia intermedia]UNK25120.1 YodC family protein [Yersinia intermedia]CRY77147.1 Uncharacterized small protein (DUF2158) [Yersinia intermedia]
MSISEPKIGNLVTLISGGPAMTIKNIGYTKQGSCELTCVWFTKDEQLNEGVFRSEITERLERQSNPVEGNADAE